MFLSIPEVRSLSGTRQNGSSLALNGRFKKLCTHPLGLMIALPV